MSTQLRLDPVDPSTHTDVVLIEKPQQTFEVHQGSRHLGTICRFLDDDGTWRWLGVPIGSDGILSYTRAAAIRSLF